MDPYGEVFSEGRHATLLTQTHLQSTWTCILHYTNLNVNLIVYGTWWNGTLEEHISYITKDIDIVTCIALI